MRIEYTQAESRLPAAGERFVEVLREERLRAVLYAPRGHDPQTPHREDEIYVVVSGRGVLRVGSDRVPFAPGDLLYVPAGVDHRFEEFSEDFATWAIFARHSAEGSRTG